MEYKLNRESLPACETVYDGCAEQPIDLDFSLPDYCPDIQKILKCQVTPSVTAQNLMGDRLEVEGTVTIRVLYLDASGKTYGAAKITIRSPRPLRSVSPRIMPWRLQKRGWNTSTAVPPVQDGWIFTEHFPYAPE